MFNYPKMIFYVLFTMMLTFVWKPSVAAEAAHESLIGFSSDGRYFAFEEYGIQDGSGFPYSTIYIIDLIEDKWAGGSPFSRVLRTELAPLKVARAAVRLRAKPALLDLDISEPATVLFARGVGELRTLETPITVNVPYPSSLIDSQPRHSFMLSLSTEEVSGTSNCPDPTIGFRLVQTLNGTQSEIHQDDTIPSSRGCTRDYRISRVLSPTLPGKANLGVALISVFRFGFEGLDRRFIAVPVPLP